MSSTTLTRIDIRIDKAKKRMIAKAALLAGQNLTQYIMGLVWPDAERRLNEDTNIKLSARDWKLFCERLDAPTTDLKQLNKLLSRPSKFRNE